MFWENIGNLFSGKGWRSNAEVDREKERERERFNTQIAPHIRNNTQPSAQIGISVNAPKNLLSGNIPSTQELVESFRQPKVALPKKQGEARLKELQEQFLPSAREEQKKGGNFIGNWWDDITGQTEARANLAARTKALNAYNEETGYQNDNFAQKYARDNTDFSGKVQNARNARDLTTNTVARNIFESPKNIASLPGLVPLAFDWVADNSRRVGLKASQARRGITGDAANIELERLNRELDNDALSNLTRGYFGMVDDANRRFLPAAARYADEAESNRQNAIDALVRSQGDLTVGQKLAATLGDIIDPSMLIPTGLAAKGLSTVSRAGKGVPVSEIERAIELGTDRIPITGVSESVPINVRNLNQERPLIQELIGDARTPADGVVPQQQPVTLPRTNNRMDDIRSGSSTSPDTITRQELTNEINAVRNDPNLSTAEKNDIIRQLEESGGTRIPIRKQVSVDFAQEAPKVAKKDIKEASQGEKTITQQEVEKMKQAQEAESVGVRNEDLEGMTPQDRENTIAAAQNNLNAPAEPKPPVDTSGRAMSQEGFAPTGEFATGKGGDVYEVSHAINERELGRQEVSLRSIDDVIDEMSNKPMLNQTDSRKIEATLDKIVAQNPDTYTKLPEYIALKKLGRASNRNAAKQLALIQRIRRKVSSGRDLTTRWIDKVADTVGYEGIPDEAIVKVTKANDDFELARNNYEASKEIFTQSRTKENLDRFKQAKVDMEKADLDARQAEFNAANSIKGMKGEKYLDDLRSEADLGMMDYVTANQLSGPATGFRNLVGTKLAGLENRVFANTRGKITNLVTGENVGGYSRAGAKAGRKEGNQTLIRNAVDRAKYSGKNPFKHTQNFATTLNQLGEGSLHAQTQSRLLKYYQNKLKSQGITGEQAKIDAEFMRLTDPDTMGQEFMDATMKASGLTGIHQKSAQIENTLSKYLAGKMSEVFPERFSEPAAKAAIRITVGYPTAVLNFLAQSSKRLTAGLPSYVEFGARLARGDKKGAAFALDRAMKESGSGLAVGGIGFALGSAGLISGSYPDDEAERERWAREGISENSIKIGNAWHPIPQGFGMLGLPLMVGAAVGRDGVDGVVDIFKPKNLSKLMPTDQIQGFLNFASGDATENQAKNTVASAIRSFIPAGSFLNQTAKGLDPTKNDTTTRDFWQNVIDQVASGIPVVNSMADIPDAKDSQGNPISNPNLLQVYTGASSVEQPKGAETTAKIKQQVSSSVSGMSEAGVFDRPILKDILDDEAKLAWDKATSGQELSEKELKSIQDNIVRGVGTGLGADSDTAYRERGDYDTDLAVLKVKKQLLEADKTTPPSTLKNLDTQIRRSEILKESQIPYELLSLYQQTDQSEWRAMAKDDPDTYRKLAAIDQLFAENGVSYRSGNITKPKYTTKSGSGRKNQFAGLSGTTVNWGQYMPKVQEYSTASLMPNATPLPKIKAENPRIIHKITSR